MTDSGTSSVRAPLGFAPADRVVADVERPGLLRSPTVERSTAYDDRGVVYEVCTIRDLDTTDEPPGFVDAGFEAVHLPDEPGLLALLAEIRDDGRVETERADRLRLLLTGAEIGLADGSRLRVEHVADDGLIVRQAGPDGVVVEGVEHHGAVNVHIDQDVLGTPLRQLFDGGAADVFGHHSPDSRNDTATQFLVNLWMPLRQVTRPLTLLDGRSFERRRHQLRYALPVDGFLDREEDQASNDIWQCLHDPAQEWWFRPETALGDAYVFDTLSTAHASFVLPGEEAAADRYRRLGGAIEAVRSGDPEGARELASEPPTDVDPSTPDSIRATVRSMDDLLSEAESVASTARQGELGQAWCARAEAARDGVVRRSLELRAVVTRMS